MEKEYIIYYGSILLASFFGWLSQKFATDKKEKFKLNKVFFILSILSLVFIMGFRTQGVGVDDNNYNRIFDQIKENGIWNYFMQTKLEPGYALANYIVGLFTDDFQVFIFLSSLIPTILFYKAIEYERKHVNYFLVIFLYGTVLHLYFFSITRLFIAASIVTYALRYVFEKKSFKYVMLVLLATTFHYSAIWMLLLLYFSTEKEEKPRDKKKTYIIAIVIFPIALAIFFNVIVPMIGTGKYEGYITQEVSGFSISDLDTLPFIILSLIFEKSISKDNPRIKIYNFMYALSLIIAIYSKFVGIGRLQWYLSFSLCIILPSVVRELIKSKYKSMVVLLFPLIIIYGFWYSYRIVFVQSGNEGMRNYSNVLWKEG